MANAYYNHGSIPADNSQGSSAEIRAEFDSVTAGFAKLPTLTGNGSELVVVNAGETALETQSASTLVAAQIHGATAKATPADADELPMADSAASYALKNFTFENLWTWIQAKLNGATAKTTPTGADTLPLSDSAAAGATKTLSITNLVTYLSGLCSAGWNAATATTAAACSGNAATATNATNATNATSATTATNQSGGTVNSTSVVSSGQITSSSSSAGVGYAAGSGATVTQATSKTTGVTINAVNGTIITTADSMAAGAEIHFSVTNSAIAADDLVVVNCFTGNYTIEALGYTFSSAVTASGSLMIAITNRSTGTRAEAITIRFAVIKSVTA